MSDLRKAAQDVVTVWKMYGTAESLRGWMQILEAALAQQPDPAQEPVGEMRLSEIIDGMVVPAVPAELPVGTKLYTAPPQRPPLTDEEMRKLWSQYGYKSALCMRFARAIERKVRGETE